jgi:glutamyl-tRNA(Gln) amidotransferase subunit E
MQTIGYVPRKEATPETYARLGFKSGLEIHQQLKTQKKLFCRCPAGIYQKEGEYDAELIRHMRPTLSELGEYDGTALMEFKTRKNIFYRIKNETACTYDIDDTPPFQVSLEALRIAMKIALLLKTRIVGELHITRKQYLDGSIPTGFQRTGIIGIEGEITLSNKTVRVIQMSLEEDACREVSDVGHSRIYTTDRLGMPLIEVVTYPDMITPDEVAEAANAIRFLTRSTDLVNTGIGAAREDVNVSIEDGTRVEIKGVSRIKWIPELVHNEAFRQKALLEIKKILHKRIKNQSVWQPKHRDVTDLLKGSISSRIPELIEKDYRLTAMHLPGFQGLLPHFTQPGKTFAHELSDRLKVVACLERPNMTHSQDSESILSKENWKCIQSFFKEKLQESLVVFWGPDQDMKTAVETIDERCRLAFEGVPNETRKSLPDGTTLFERVLPGPDRMYPDTDTAPIPITETMIREAGKDLPTDVSIRIRQMRDWKIPEDAFTYILKRNHYPLLIEMISRFQYSPKRAGTLIGHHLKYLEGQYPKKRGQIRKRLMDLFLFIHEKHLNPNILKDAMTELAKQPKVPFNEILKKMKYKKRNEKEILSKIPEMRKQIPSLINSHDGQAGKKWLMGQLRPFALGNIDLKKVRDAIEEDGHE